MLIPKSPARLLFLLLLLFSAQGISAQRVEFGTKAGISLPWLSGPDWADSLSSVDGENNFAIRFVGGAYAAYRFSPELALQLEVLYTRTGGAYSYSYQVASYNYNYAGTVRAPTVDIPLLFRGKLPVGPGGFYAGLGPGMTILPDTVNYKEESGDLVIEAERQPDQRAMLSGTIETGYLFELDRWLIDLGLRYSRTLTPFYSNSAEDGTYFNNFGVILGGGYRF
jgi:hypothetical protein